MKKKSFKKIKRAFGKKVSNSIEVMWKFIEKRCSFDKYDVQKVITTPIRKVKNIYKNINRIIKWVPIIYNDRNWDEHYLYKILWFKLKTMEEFWKSDEPWCMKQDKTARQIMICRKYAERLMNDDYLANALMWHNQKFEDRPIEEWFGPCENNPNLKQFVPDLNKAREDSFHRCSKHADYMEKQDRQELFRLLNKYINGWWD